jgi:hypothetical protein
MIKSRVFVVVVVVVVVRSQSSSEDVRLSNRVGKMKDRKPEQQTCGSQGEMRITMQ